jgi:hypothetical protein
VRIFLIFSLLLLSTQAWAEDWTTTDGKFYEAVRVVRIEDDAVTIVYKYGGALIPLVKLPAPLQRKFSYDPERARIASIARAKADAENAKALQAEIDLATKMKQDRLKNPNGAVSSK